MVSNSLVMHPEWDMNAYKTSLSPSYSCDNISPQNTKINLMVALAVKSGVRIHPLGTMNLMVRPTERLTPIAIRTATTIG